MDRETCESSCVGEKAEVEEGFLSQAVTGELVGMLNYLGMVELSPDLTGKEEALEHAESERRHAEAFRGCARELGLKPIENVGSPFWGKVRSAFVHWAGRGDRIACTLLQGVMLESFAAALYYAVGDAVDGRMAQLFQRIGREEESHVEDSQRILGAEYRRDPGVFEEKAKRVHDSILPGLVRMMAQEDQDGPCGLCRVRCIKGLLPRYGMRLGDLRTRSLGIYQAKLDGLGLPPRTTRAWVNSLPAGA
jgi:rubrerythrin